MFAPGISIEIKGHYTEPGGNVTTVYTLFITHSPLKFFKLDNYYYFKPRATHDHLKQASLQISRLYVKFFHRSIHRLNALIGWV